ncbi:MAG: glycosyltransferase family 2 protein [Planctomycetes bacterium]|nr:glycosyltransferase family 2 protein [Planctomycetota bacterium]
MAHENFKIGKRNQVLFVSVVIATYNRTTVLLDTAKYLLEQNYPAFEIIVVDQTEIVSERMRVFFDDLKDEKVRYIHLDQPGLPNARNVGIRAARGDIVLFVDDDTKPANENFIRRHAENYAESEIVGVAGRVYDSRYSECNDPNRILKLTRWGTIKDEKNGTVRTEIDTLGGTNMSFRRQVAVNAECWFDENIAGTFQGEDLTFSLMLKRTGGRLIFDPRADLYHYALPTGGDDSRSIPPLLRHFWRVHNMTLIWLKNRDIVNPVIFAVGRLAANLRIAYRARDIRAWYWLSYAMYLAFRTYRDKELPREAFNRVEKALR